MSLEVLSNRKSRLHLSKEEISLESVRTSNVFQDIIMENKGLGALDILKYSLDRGFLQNIRKV
tara:strand:+ start:448 stop:636 length:189 start_codon:yes stop_codon:yes gene_type:complete